MASNICGNITSSEFNYVFISENHILPSNENFDNTNVYADKESETWFFHFINFLYLELHRLNLFVLFLKLFPVKMTISPSPLCF